MDPAEEIVSLWMNQNGLFFRPNVKVGYRGKEIDFLAVGLGNDGHIKKQIHIEVHASVSPLGPLRPWSPAKYNKLPMKDRVKFYFLDKYVGPTIEGTGELRNNCIEQTVTNVFGTTDYEKWLVLGKLHRKDSREELKTEFLKYNVKVFYLEDILKDIRFKGTARDKTGRFVQLLAATLTEDAQRNLLKKK